MKIGEKSLKLSNGKIIHFKSKKHRDNYERIAQAYKHGWRPNGNKK